MGKALRAVFDTADNISISTRRVSNGYVVTESRSTGDDYQCREYITETKPTLTASTGMDDYLGSADGPSGPRGLAPASAELRRGRKGR